MVQCDEVMEDDRPSNTLELFSELDEVLQMIEYLKVCHSVHFEKEYETFSEILTRYQEQPHLLDKHLEVLLSHLLSLIRNDASPASLVHAAFKYLYIICKVRTYKVLVKFLPHELSDLEFALDLLEKQNPKESDNWETKYILLLWMSILVLNPFHMSRLDAYITEESANCAIHGQPITKMERIFKLCKVYSEQNNTCSGVTAFLTAKYLIRADIKEIYLENYFQMVVEEHTGASSSNTKYGQLAAVATILKIGKREDLFQYADMLLKWIISCNYKESSDYLKYKYFIKIIQRIGLVYLKPVLASWRYQRGVRSLATNLLKDTEIGDESLNVQEMETIADDNELTIPDAIEEVIEELLQGLRSSSSDIRWSSAKGIGRVASRLPKELGDEVIGSIIEMLNPIEPHEAWHGACLAIAELAKRGLLLPYRLKELVTLLMQALFYDEMKGYMSVGQHIRDAACYMCWAFARAYEPADLQPFVNQIASGLLIVACFDREINCRRAASAAFQESVGRLGNFPYGIEISTTTDFYTVGLRQNAYLEISDFIAQYPEYRTALIDHLVERKVGHWDISIRELSAKALSKLTNRAPAYMADEVLPKLFHNSDSIDINLRHGAILAIGEIVFCLKSLDSKDKSYLTNGLLNQLNDLILKFIKRDQFRGMSGEIMKSCCTDFIRNCSKARVEVNEECIVSWQQIVDKCIVNKNIQIREGATAALMELCSAYYDDEAHLNGNLKLIDCYMRGSENDLDEHIRMGYISGLGALPKCMLKLRLNEIVDILVKHSLPPHGGLQALISGRRGNEYENAVTVNWSEARRDSIKALSNIVKVIGYDINDNESLASPIYLEKIFNCFSKASDEYTLDNRGDIGAWVREAAMCALTQFLTSCPTVLLKPEHVHQVMTGLAQQAVEKIDRTRGLAGKLFCNLIYAVPTIPYIPQHDRLKDIFPAESSAVLWLFADHTFPLFCSLLEFKEYSPKLLLGLSASIGQLTESLIKYSSSSFFKFLRSHPNELPRICKDILNIFEENSLNERVTYPILNFLDILLSSGTVNSILMDESYNFADEILRLVNAEIKGHKKLYKLVSSINVYCQLIQVPRLSTKILSKMSVFLGLTHVHVRKTTATKLYEALALHGDALEISEENLDEILTVLSETDWGLPLLEVRPIRNQLCILMNIKPPVANNTVSIASN